MGLGPGFWATEHLPLLCQQANSIQCVKNGLVTHIQAKAFAGTRVGGGGVF